MLRSNRLVQAPSKRFLSNPEHMNFQNMHFRRFFVVFLRPFFNKSCLLIFQILFEQHISVDTLLLFWDKWQELNGLRNFSHYQKVPIVYRGLIDNAESS